MIRLIGWLAVGAFLWYTGILAATLIFLGAATIWIGTMFASLGGML